MFKFFRRIRFELLEKNKTGKYLKYAIGEIVLVVIGILIALGINNWNQKRIVSNQTEDLLVNMITDLKTDIARYDLDIGRLEESIAGGTFILKSKSFESISADSIYNLLPNNIIFYKIASQTYERLKNLSVTQIGDSSELFNDITAYYTFHTVHFETLINWDSEETFQMLQVFDLDDKFESPIYVNKDFIPYSDSETIRKNTLLSLLSEIKSRNYIRQAISRKSLVSLGIQSIKLEAETLIASIEDELVKK
jgi:competence protein ComGC